ncbi:bifunctional Rhomboid-like superfamily/Peptidase S54 [Babesia duncani]|uniref:rhomboid protease n=1 Tax=Babesia duncani TaxID=323732 RepID=A0AAD9PIJ9_9APIC|nr:bifunctional Rhomboid-like superfamily/Peptidase S54 [Babesia duncani]
MGILSQARVTRMLKAAPINIENIRAIVCTASADNACAMDFVKNYVPLLAHGNAHVDIKTQQNTSSSHDSCSVKLIKLVVNRRSPINPLSLLPIGKKPKDVKNNRRITNDPTLKNNPVYGRLAFCISMTAMLFIVFIAELVFNKLTFNGRCLSNVLYPQVKPSNATGPYMVEVGYGACEYNLQTDARKIFFVGTATDDKGWPRSMVQDFRNVGSRGYIDGPNGRIFEHIGGLNTNKIRTYNEHFRLFWSIFLHGSWKHLIMNILGQLQSLWIIEPARFQYF